MNRVIYEKQERAAKKEDVSCKIASAFTNYEDF